MQTMLPFGEVYGHLPHLSLDIVYLRPFQNSIGDHVCIFIDTAVLRVDTEQQTAHPKEKEQNKCCLNAFPGWKERKRNVFNFISHLPKLLDIWNFLCLEFWQEDSDNVEEKEEIYLQY